MKKYSNGYKIIKKEESDSEINGYTSQSSEISESEISENESESSGGGSAYKYLSITETKYKGKSKQAEYTKDEIKEKLRGYRPLKNSDDKKYLLTLTPFKTWIKYFNTNTKEFRVGGLLKLVDPQLRFIMLVNTNSNITWSVQLKDNIIFVPSNPNKTQFAKNKKVYKTSQSNFNRNQPIVTKLNTEREQDKKEEDIKDKLYKLYKAGKLSKN